MDRNPNKLFYTLEEFAEILRSSVVKIRRLVKNGTLPFLQPSGPKGQILIPQKALDDLISRAYEKSSEILSEKAQDKIPGRPSKFRSDGTMSNKKCE